MCEVLAMSLF